ncbi:MAG TPA: VWA domain-containing protein [Candidatus Sulfotelmatobacter sp.]
MFFLRIPIDGSLALKGKTLRLRIEFLLAGTLLLAVPVACGQNQQSQDVPDAPSTAQPPAPAPPARLDDKVSLPPPPSEGANPTDSQPDSNSSRGARPKVPHPDFPQPNSGQPNPSQPGSDDMQPPPAMPPVRTVPPGSRQNSPGQEQLYKLTTNVNFVQVPVTVKDVDGRRVDGLLPKDFVVLENGKKQTMSFFTSDPFELSVAVVIDLGLPDAAVQKINQTYPAMVGAFSPYDEVGLYTYSSTVSQVSDFNPPTQKLTAVLNQMKTERGRNNGVPVLSGPLAPNGPIINGIPAGSPTQPVYTPPKEAHVLNDAILQAALDLSKREKTRRKVIFVVSDGREMGSKASYGDVLKLLLAQGIQVKAIALENGALPIYKQIERLHLPREGYGNLLPKYASATGGGQIFTEFTRNAIENAYAQVTSEARNQYTLGYTTRATASSAYRNIEVRVARPGLKIYAKDGYYPIASAR